MTEGREAIGCRILGTTVTGAKHRHRGQDSQDALAWRPESRVGPPACIAIADGHGSAASFRSAVGSQFAVDAAMQVLGHFLESYRDRPATLVKRTAEERLPREIVREWTRRVREHHRDRPFLEIETAGVADRVLENPLLAYGSTLLAVGVVESAMIWLQLGDGDALLVDRDGRVSRPLSGDQRNFADETTSLCLPDAERDFRFAFQSIAAGPPSLALLATDGYSNCFASDDEFLKVGPDLAELLETHGPDIVERQLAEHLAAASEQFSGDDITVGMLWFQ